MHQLGEVLEDYTDRAELWEQLKPIVAEMDRGEAARAMGITKRQLRNVLHGKGIPGPAGVADIVGHMAKAGHN